MHICSIIEVVRMGRRKGQLEWQKKVYLKAHDLLKKTLIEAEKGMTKMDLHKATGLARTTIDRHLYKIMNFTKELKIIEKSYYWGDKYDVLIKKCKEDAALVEEIDVLVNRQKEIINKLSRPANIRRWKKEGTPPHWNLGLPERIPINTNPDAPATITFLTPEEEKEMFLYNENVFGGLRRIFFELAKVVMKVDVGFIYAEEDLSNVTISFRNGRALWSLNSIRP